MGDEEQEYGSKALVEKVFGEELGRRMAEAEGSYRKVLEPTPATTQCKKAMKRPFNPGEECYICGVAIPNNKLRRVEDPLYVECEHILPIGQARTFLDIYTHLDLTEIMDKSGLQWYDKVIQLEYKQSHRLCNQKKRDTSFIGNPNLDAVKVEFSDQNARTILSEIQKEANDLKVNPRISPADRSIYSKIAAMEIENRIADIRPIIDEIINCIGIRKTDESSLLLLSRVGALMNPGRIPEKARRIYYEYNQVIPRNPKEEFVKKSKEMYPELIDYKTYFYKEYSPIPEGVRINLNKSIDETLGFLYEKTKKISYDEIFLRASIEYTAFKLTLRDYFEKGGSYDEDNKYWLNFVVNTMNNIEKASEHMKIPDLFDADVDRTITKLKQSIYRDEREREREARRNVGNPDMTEEELRLWNFETSVGFAIEVLNSELIKEGIKGIGNWEESIKNHANQTFQENYRLDEGGGSNFDEARTETAQSTATIVLLTLTPWLEEETAQTMASNFYDLMMDDRGADELQDVNGGLRRRFHFKQNARISHLGNLRSAKHSRLRKRTRKGRTYRLRQRSSKPKSRRQRKSLGGVRLA